MAIDFLEPFLCGQKGHKHQPKAVSVRDARGGDRPNERETRGLCQDLCCQYLAVDFGGSHNSPVYSPKIPASLSVQRVNS